MKISVVGDIIIDQYIYGSVERISPEAPIPVLKYKTTETKSGGAGNVFDNIKSLYDNVTLATTCDNPPIKTRFIANNQHLLRVDYEGQSLWSSVVNDSDLVVISDYNKGAVTSELLKSLKTKTIIDPKRHLSFYQGSWCIKPNKKEFEESCGQWTSISELEKLMVNCFTEFQFSHLIVTLGDQGVAYYDGKNFTHLPSVAQEVFDVTGAGDTFTAVLAYGVANSLSMIDAVKLANRAAGIAVSHFGTYVITKEDLGLNQKDSIVFTNGCFDILHRGHIEYLKKSKELGNKLIVGVNSDESVKRLKGNSRPINSEIDRKFLLENLPFVDEVIIFEQDTPYELIKSIRPDIITKGGDYCENDVVGSDLAKVVIIPYESGYSTTSIVDKIKND